MYRIPFDRQSSRRISCAQASTLSIRQRIAMFLLVLALGTVPALATTGAVDTTSDSASLTARMAMAADCPLRGAITAVNAAPGPQLIVLDGNVFSVAQAITLTSALPPISNAMRGDGAGAYMLNGDGAANAGNLHSAGTFTAHNSQISDASCGITPGTQGKLDGDPMSDTTPPTLLSFTRQNPLAAVTNADMLTFRASFSESVQNVDSGDFAVDGATSAGVTGVSAVDASHYDITVSGGDLAGFDGTVGLDLAAVQDITDTDGNALADGEPVTDETYTLDNTPPAAPSKPNMDAASDTGKSATDNLTKDTMSTFSGGAEAGSTVVLRSNVDGVLGSAVASSGHWSITPASPMSEGAHKIKATATDGVGNVSSASAALSMILDTTPPVASITSAYGASVNAPFLATFSFSEHIHGFSDTDLTLSNASINPITNAQFNSARLRLTPTGTDPSTIQVALAPGTVTDTAGNANVAGPDFSITYDTSIAGPRCYVNQIASGSNAGSPWADAYTDLQSALANARCNEVWVAMGVYKPTASNARSASFVLVPDVAVYGGFAGTETDRDQRMPGTNPTILSGDIGTPGYPGDNSWHVVIASNTDYTSVLDGFTISGGQADDQASPDDSGGGILNEGGNPTLNNLHIRDNAATYGGGMAISGSGTVTEIQNSTIRGNSALYGGGLRNLGADITLHNVTISGNQATRQRPATAAVWRRPAVHDC